jgi:transposase
MEDWAEVHRLLHREGGPKARIARELGMSCNTVDRLPGLKEPPVHVREPAPSKLDPFKDQVRAMLAADPSVPATVQVDLVAHRHQARCRPREPA